MVMGRLGIFTVDERVDRAGAWLAAADATLPQAQTVDDAFLAFLAEQASGIGTPTSQPRD
jgi:hypothetical protein